MAVSNGARGDTTARAPQMGLSTRQIMMPDMPKAQSRPAGKIVHDAQGASRPATSGASASSTATGSKP
jgi:hypothetical protein